MKNKTNTTSTQVANLAGVSQSTVSRAYLPESPVTEKTRKKVLEAHRGVNGGYKPFKKLEDISVKDLIEAVEGPVSLTDCIDNNARNCNLFDVCITKHTWGVVNSAIRDTLESIKVKDISSTKNSNKLLSFI